MTTLFQCPHCARARMLPHHLEGQQVCEHLVLPGERHAVAFTDGGAGVWRRGLHAGIPSLGAPAMPFLRDVTDHIQRTIGASPMVFHETVSDDISMNLHIVPPPPHAACIKPDHDHPYGRNFFTLVTSGLSKCPMKTASGAAPRFAELMISLPADWPGLQADGTFEPGVREEANWWPIRWLKAIAHMMHEEGVFLEPGSMIPTADDAEPFSPETDLAYMAVLPSRLHPASTMLRVNEETSIAFYALWPLTVAERAIRTHGNVEKLKWAFAAQGVTDLVDTARESLVK